MSSSNVVRVNSDYKIQTDSGRTITLDTGNNVGLVLVTGDLTVQGNTTTVNTSNVTIEDNILVLNSGETGNKITLGTSGIEIDRGTNSDGNAQILFDENLTYRDPSTNTSRLGLFVFKTKQSNKINGIRTNSIDTDGGNLTLIGFGSGVVNVRNTIDYERNVLDYTNNLELIDDDIIPNMRAVADKIQYVVTNNPTDRIVRDDTSVVAYDSNISTLVTKFTSTQNSTSVRVTHSLIPNSELNINVGNYLTIFGSGIPNLDGTWIVNQADPADDFCDVTTAQAVSAPGDGIPNIGTVIIRNTATKSARSRIRVTVDNTVCGEFYNNNCDLYNIRISGSSIESLSSNSDLILSSPGTGSVRIQDNLRLEYVSFGQGHLQPAPGTQSVKIYTNTEGAGNTGIYFVNPTFALNTGSYRRDELISKKKAIAFSILM